MLRKPKLCSFSSPGQLGLGVAPGMQRLDTGLERLDTGPGVLVCQLRKVVPQRRLTPSAAARCAASGVEAPLRSSAEDGETDRRSPVRLRFEGTRYVPYIWT
mmetsp:Transcript_61939/g.111455  ORF Transcript_61939/g.111455 Transcript_61939/m.111455 type:complete len:102 (-) Transcript_61939:66-371(-)